MSPIFIREKGYAFKIYSNEEERMHVHVVKEDKEAKFWLEPKVEVATKGADVLMINDKGIMISVQGQDYFLSYNRVPWMRNATISEVLDVRMSGKNAIEWPKLDVDLEVDSLKHPERYPLIIKRNELDFVAQ